MRGKKADNTTESLGLVGEAKVEQKLKDPATFLEGQVLLRLEPPDNGTSTELPRLAPQLHNLLGILNMVAKLPLLKLPDSPRGAVHLRAFVTQMEGRRAAAPTSRVVCIYEKKLLTRPSRLRSQFHILGPGVVLMSQTFISGKGCKSYRMIFVLHLHAGSFQLIFNTSNRIGPSSCQHLKLRVCKSFWGYFLT